MFYNDITRLCNHLCRLSVRQLFSLNDYNHAWLPWLQGTTPEDLATSICASISARHADREEDFLEKLAWLYAWLIPQSSSGFSWGLYRRNDSPTSSADNSVRQRFMALIDYPGCRMTHATIDTLTGIYSCIITTDSDIWDSDRISGVFLAIWHGRPLMGVTSFGRITIGHLYRALSGVLAGPPLAQLEGTFKTFASMYAVVHDDDE
ncbi:hypothetical protein MRX96_000486 [Rhipicephalus microplus]|uniref:Uncharacterized protein n=1 Tax=Rhipicephalus microplus TaxID=6941 RepID=A0A6M2D9I1_RHIMP|nr:hypothetical protein HPB51_021592 [Rhipicephalus microplus]